MKKKKRQPVPVLGIIGIEAMREAFAGDYEQLGDLLRGALRLLFKLAGDEDPWPYVRALFDDRVVVERDGKLWSYPYSIAGTDVTLGDPTEVIVSYTPATGMREGRSASIFIEAAGTGRYLIRVIRAGLSGNGNFYSDALLRGSVSLFEGVRVFVKGDREHLAGEGKDFRNLIGRLTAPVFVEGAGLDSGEIRAVLELLNPEGEEAVKLKEAWERGMTALFGFSIDATGTVKPGRVGTRSARIATQFIEVKSVDLIVEPGAGGQVIGLVESRQSSVISEETVMDRTQIIALLEAQRPDLLKGKKKEELTDEQLQELLREATKPAVVIQPQNQPAPITAEQLQETIRMSEARAHARVAIAESNLPAKAKEKLRARFAALTTFTEAEVDTAIADERTYIASFTESGAVRMGDLPSRIESGETRAEKVAAMLDAFFDPAHKDHRHARSFRECYTAITGDKRVTGRIEDCDQALMRESLLTGTALRESLDSGSWANVLGDSITRRMIADYRLDDLYSVWQRICYRVPTADFRTQERTRYGGYGDLPTVNQGAAYQSLTSPTDEKATYAVTKRGGTEDVTLEMIKNDDVGAIQRIPMKLSRSAKRTLSKFVFDFIRTNPTIYDGVAFFHATHGNLGSTAFDAAAYAAARLLILKQTELSSADRLGIPPRILLVPVDVQEAAFNAFQRATENDKKFIATITPDIIPVWYWTDTNDWAVLGDPVEAPAIEIGFLDGNEEPELFVQDNPTVGSMFSNDKLTYKIRHIYGGNVVDFRPAFKAVVA